MNEKKEKKSQAFKMIFLSYAFDVKEMHTLFMKFYRDFDKDENMTFDKDEMT